MNKKVLRALYRQKRATIPPEQQALLSQQIAQQTLRLPIWDKQIFHSFLSIPSFGEVDTSYLIRLLQERGKTLVVSRTVMETVRMEHFRYDPSQIQADNKWHIPEPQGGIPVKSEEIEVVFVPLLAYDTKGNRVGYGKGFYDNFLEECKTDTLKIGLSFFPAEPLIKDVREGDIPLDYVVTPEGVFKF
ncbi:5-formyltetrahydrofolate cyclo-ligase [Capnocytophaga gingivalis]|uniref:5-formyltetrahydrofolate cyclo-ligase n=1 Tax=Capnocytophaga gingivalis TaxID=1017 RepID=UPI0028D73A67|nr:5-formyltetrahydrofolate cyclo-ligase [Capnocytophaga gingivalis]